MATIRQNPFTARVATAATTEARALLFAAAAFVVAGVVGLLVVGFESVPISGTGSLGAIAGVIAGIISGVVFAIGYVLPAPQATRRERPERTVWLLVLDNVALALAHGFTVLLLVVGVSIVMQDAFIDAVVFPFTSAVIIAAVAALAAYITFLSAAQMNTANLAGVLAVFLVVGVMAAMLSTSDPHWWQSNISALGMGAGVSSATFAITLVVAGVIITALGGYLAAELETGTMAKDPRDADDRHVEGRIRRVRLLLTLLGVFLVLVGVFPVDFIVLIHNTFATGLVVIFGILVIGAHRLIPRLPALFLTVGYVFLAIVVFAALLFAFGVYNLTAVEVLGFLLIFTWLILLIRNVSAGSADTRAAA